MIMILGISFAVALWRATCWAQGSVVCNLQQWV